MVLNVLPVKAHEQVLKVSKNLLLDVIDKAERSIDNASFEMH